MTRRHQPALSQSVADPMPDPPKPPEPVFDKPGKVSVSRFRLLPLTMMMAVLLLAVKSAELYTHSQELKRVLNQDALAQEEQQPQQAEPTPQPAQGEPEQNGQTLSAGGPDEVELASLEPESEESQPQVKREFTQIELDILQSLAERRKELEERKREVDLKEKLLEATELRVNDKLSEMKGLKKQVDALLKEHKQLEDKKVDGLVKIYETMKPKDAAKIFNELDMPIMLLVVDRMSSRRVAPILAEMAPARARELTIELAEYRRLKALPQSLSADQNARNAAEMVQ